MWSLSRILEREFTDNLLIYSLLFILQRFLLPFQFCLLNQIKVNKKLLVSFSMKLLSIFYILEDWKKFLV